MNLFDLVVAKKLAGGGGGGGGSSYTLLAEQDFEVSTTSITAVVIGTIQLEASLWSSAKMLYCRTRDKAGKQASHYYGTDAFVINEAYAGGYSSTQTVSRICYQIANGLVIPYAGNNGIYGVYPTKWEDTGALTISARYSSTYAPNLSGTYHVEVYTLEWPDNVSPFVTE